MSLKICTDFNCLRTDHLICPVSICHELLHSSKVGIIKKCTNYSCLDESHVKCPSCGVTLHFQATEQ